MIRVLVVAGIILLGLGLSIVYPVPGPVPAPHVACQGVAGCRPMP